MLQVEQLARREGTSKAGLATRRIAEVIMQIDALHR